MVFSSLLFLFAYLPLALMTLALPKKWHNGLLFFFSLLFYGWGEPVYILVMLFSITTAWALGFPIARYLETDRRRARGYMILSVCLNLASLLFFKYANFFIQNLRLLPFLQTRLSPITGLTLPVGISFYTFQIMSYTIDLYRGQTGVQRNFVAFGTYVTLFPQLIAGPIVRYRDVDDQLLCRTESVKKFSCGVRRFVVGLAKKILIGDAAAAVYEYSRAAAGFTNTTLGAWMVMLFYALHIYYDFSGYSDMAIGLGKMFGFTFLENFEYPYISRSVTEFWRRWHMSLGTWFKEYVYIPLGGNRTGKRWKTYRNIAIVWLLTGFWHGASWNFVLWGAYFGVLLMLEKTFLLRWLDKLPACVGHLYALLCIGVGWLLFSYTDMQAGVACMGALFGVGCDAFTTPTLTYTALRALPLFLLAAAGSTPLPKKAWQLLTRRMPCLADWSSVAMVGAGLVLVTSYLVDSTFSPFLYYIF